MIIDREWRIVSIEASITMNAPLVIEVEEEGLRKGRMHLNAEACARFKIQPAFSLVGKTLRLTLESRSIPVKADERDRVDWGGFNADGVLIEELSETKEIEFLIYMIPPKRVVKLLRLLKVRTRGDTFLPCPYYDFQLELTAEEFRECRALPILTYFVVRIEVLEEA